MKCTNVFHAQHTACGECLEALELAAAAVIDEWRSEHRDPDHGAKMSSAMLALYTLLTPPSAVPAAASPRRKAKRA